MATEIDKPETKKLEPAKPAKAAASPTFELTGGVYKEMQVGEGVEFNTPSGEKLFIRFGGNHDLQNAFREFSKAQK